MQRKLIFEGIFDRLRRRRANRRAVQELSRSLALIVDREALEASVAARIRELLDPERMIILEPDRTAGAFLPGFYFGLPESDLAGLLVPARGKLARWLSVNETCLILDRQPGVHEYLDPAERDLLDRLRLNVCVPMISLNRLTGILLLGLGRLGGGLGRSDVELLNLLASQASLAFENAALYRAQRERLDRLYRAERLAAVGQLAAGVAHEIRNPLTAIRSTMQYLLRDLDPAQPKHQLVEELLSEVDRINSTVGGLLSLSRSGEVRRVEIDLLGIVGKAVQLVQAQAAEKGVEVASDFALPESRILGDAGQLKQVFLNLLLNALQSMNGGGRIVVTARAWRPEGGGLWAQVRVADTGPGIPPDQLRRVFDPFYT
ncbi:MAG TPA: histidine kinase dimerization/phospho-acceptor domain-containing protein, partial [Thermoanaerobaculia bacterium]|nr:histidine kinase dimerization/phospho-acceptor domain-containing protein [Thermoanaerobaculia bacterium]